MKVPPGLKEYEESVRTAKNLLNRLKKGSAMLEESARTGETVMTRKIIKTWAVVSAELFTHLELATIIHQQYLTGNSVVIRSNGTFEKVEDIMDMEPEEMDAWSLLTIQKLYEVFGDDYKNMLEIKTKENPVN